MSPAFCAISRVLPTIVFLRLSGLAPDAVFVAVELMRVWREDLEPAEG